LIDYHEKKEEAFLIKKLKMRKEITPKIISFLFIVSILAS